MTPQRHNSRPDRNPARQTGTLARRDLPTVPHARFAAAVAMLGLVLTLGTVAVYAQTCRNDFVAYDDDAYVCENPSVTEGLTRSSITWAFTTFHAANWHPLTWLSHMADCELFGLHAGAHHLVNLAIHVANTALLLTLLAWMTGRLWESAFVAGVFALHPLHVESVAWVAERKDLLSTFFGLLAVAAYVHYVRRPAAARYALVPAAVALALMAKPMLVTLPFLLLLLDVWPLERLQWPPTWKMLRQPVLEKLPLLAMAAASCAVTVVAQRAGGAVQSLSKVPLAGRLANAVVGYATYIVRTVRPVDLAPLYPIHPEPPSIVVAAIAMLVAGTVMAAAAAKKRPYVLVGWLWFLGMLVPVIGFVQVGSQATADRYMYLPLVGLTIAVAWPVGDLVRRRRLAAEGAVVVACAALAALGVAAHRQVGYWQSSRPLFERTLAVTTGNCIMHNNLGVILSREGRFDEAVAHYREALALDPDYPDANANLGHELLRAVKLDEAYKHLAKAIALQPGRPAAQADMGMVLAAVGRLEESAPYLAESLRLAPRQASVHSNLGFVLQRLGRMDDAMAHYAESLRLDPGLADTHYNLGTALAMQGRTAEAATEFRKALSLQPSHPAARLELERLTGSR